MFLSQANCADLWQYKMKARWIRITTGSKRWAAVRLNLIWRHDSSITECAHGEKGNGLCEKGLMWLWRNVTHNTICVTQSNIWETVVSREHILSALYSLMCLGPWASRSFLPNISCRKMSEKIVHTQVIMCYLNLMHAAWYGPKWGHITEYFSQLTWHLASWIKEQ